MEGLNVDVDQRMREDYIHFVAQSEALGMEAGGFGDKDYGSVQTQGLILIFSASERMNGARTWNMRRELGHTITARHLCSLGKLSSYFQFSEPVVFPKT